jgi:hypothetical protein
MEGETRGAHGLLVLEQESIDHSGYVAVDCFEKDILGDLAREETSGGEEDS